MVARASCARRRQQRPHSGREHSSLRLVLERLEDRLAPAALVWTDQSDYQAGDTALITASGFALGETVKFLVLHDKSTPGIPGGEGHESWRVTDGGGGDLDGVQNGQIQTTWYVSPDDSLGATFHLRAIGLTSGLVAKTTFTDDNLNTSVSPTSVTVLAGGSSQSFSITSTVTGANASGWKFSINSVYTLSGGVFTGSVPVEYTVAAQGGGGSQTFVTSATVSALAGQSAGTFSLTPPGDHYSNRRYSDSVRREFCHSERHGRFQPATDDADGQ